MNVDRRDFFKIASAGVITATTTKTALAEPRKSLPKDAVGLLYDSTLCIGCKNHQKIEFEEGRVGERTRVPPKEVCKCHVRE